jgi:hypothetical protein
MTADEGREVVARLLPLVMDFLARSATPQAKTAAAR